jgi:hypothetical protein
MTANQKLGLRLTAGRAIEDVHPLAPAIFLSAGAFPQHLTAAGCGWNPFGFAAIPLFSNPPHVFLLPA